MLRLSTISAAALVSSIVLLIIVSRQGDHDRAAADPGSTTVVDRSSHPPNRSSLLPASDFAAVAPLPTGRSDGLEAGDQEGEGDLDVSAVRTWSQLSELAERWYRDAIAYGIVAEDRGFGYLDGVISSGVQGATRIYLNSVSMIVRPGPGSAGCRLELEAGPLKGDETLLFGRLTLQATVSNDACAAPEDTVGWAISGDETDSFRIDVLTSHEIDGTGNNTWTMAWEHSEKRGDHFELSVLAREGRYVLGFFEGYIDLVMHDGIRIPALNQRDHLVMVFRARI